MKQKEKIDLVVSWITLSVAFAFIMGAFRIGSGDIFGNLATALLAVGTGFVFHELAHRQMARRFGFHSEYRAWYPMLGFSLVMAFIASSFGFGFLVAAPGATYFFGHTVTRKQNGLISAAGPATNILVGLIFLGLTIGLIGSNIYTTEMQPIAGILFSAGYVNFFFAFFNLLPVLMFDGVKVLAWNWKAWLVMMGTSAAMIAFMMF